MFLYSCNLMNVNMYEWRMHCEAPWAYCWKRRYNKYYYYYYYYWCQSLGSIGRVVSEKNGNRQTHRQTNIHFENRRPYRNRISNIEYHYRIGGLINNNNINKQRLVYQNKRQFHFKIHKNNWISRVAWVLHEYS